ncbi:MAG: tol-pal system protein YbgF [Rhodospirillaceae bacterium]|nr:tol-pal system protein YbgF [Rhodospirillaceae bacterium]MBT5666064.1 tol-pal system protein YbgF [Rhodospirillaceae bacterium]MBT5810294.1 tol-pal system protein YbgF [Rhodospirillaceae bacterium]
MRFGVVSVLSVIAFLGAAFPSQAQDGAVVDELERLRRDLGDLQQYIYKNKQSNLPVTTLGPNTNVDQGEAAPQQGQFNARIQRQVQAMQDQMRGLTGRLEEVQHQIRTVGDRVDKLVGDVDLRLQMLEQRVLGASSAGPNATPAAPMKTLTSESPPTTVITSSGIQRKLVADPPTSKPMGTLGTVSQSTVESVRSGDVVDTKSGSATIAPGVERQAAARNISPQSRQQISTATPTSPSVAVSNSNLAALQPTASVLPPGSPKEQYDYAFSLLRKRDYQGSETALRAFIEKYPNNQLSGNAMYWMGETYYVRKDYTEAARIFLDGYQRFPKGAKAADNLLKLAKSLSEIGEKKSACASYKELLKIFPKASNRMLSAAKNEFRRLKCG